MFFTQFGNENFSLSRIWILCGQSDGMEIRITNDEYYKHDPKNKIMALKNIIKMSQMTLNDPKFDIKNTRDTLFLKIDIQIFVFPFIPSFSFYQSLLEKMIEYESQSLWCHQLVKQEFKSSLFYILSYILISESTWRILLKFAE